MFSQNSQAPAHHPVQPLLGMDLRALNARTIDPGQAVVDIMGLQLPGLAAELWWTLVALKRELATEAYRWGGSPFLPIPWSRWMEMLELNSRNAVKTRLARLEGMGLIEVLPSERGSWGSLLNGYRMGTGEGTQVFQAVMEARERSMIRLNILREAQLEGTDASRNHGEATPGAAPDNRLGGGRGRLDGAMARQRVCPA